MNYAVIIGDIIESRQATDRARLQQSLIEVLEQIDQRFAADIAVPFQITLGDEFQGMLSGPEPSPALISTLREMLYPTEVRMSIGIGDVSTEINPVITQIDGPAFHFARRGIKALSSQKRTVTAYITSDEHANQLLQALTLFSDMLLLDRTEKQWEAFRLYRLEKNLKKVAAQLNVKFQSIHKRLRAAHWDELEEADKLLAGYLRMTTFTDNRVNKQNSPKKG